MTDYQKDQLDLLRRILTDFPQANSRGGRGLMIEASVSSLRAAIPDVWQELADLGAVEISSDGDGVYVRPA